MKNLTRTAQIAYIAAQCIYANTAKFFYDPLGGDRFGGIWDPSITKPLPFRVMNHFSSLPVKVRPKLAPTKESDELILFQEHSKAKGKNRDLVVLNEDAVLSEIVRMGEGLVQR